MPYRRTPDRSNASLQSLGQQDVLERIRPLIHPSARAQTTEPTKEPAAAALASQPHQDSVASIDFTHFQILLTDQHSALSIDGASSMFDASNSCNAPVTPTKSPFAPPSSFSSDSPPNKVPRGIPKLPSRGTLIKKRTLPRGSSARGQMGRNTHLPWLDGSPSRRGSMPPIPGAFDESPAANGPTPSAMHAPIHPNRSPPTAPTESAETDETRHKRGPPLISLARELYATDSTNMDDSETEKSMKAARRRALGPEPFEATNPVPSNARRMSPILPSRAGLPRFADEDVLSPKAPATRRSTALEGSPNFPPTIPLAAPIRKPSMTVQPLRSKRVTIHQDDITPEERVRRSQPLALQPIRRKTQSLDQDLSSDIVKKPRRPKSIAARLPAEAGLRSSIAGLESLMQEAVRLTKDAANSGRSDEIPGIMDEARLALHRATIVQDSYQPVLISTGGPKSRGSSVSSSAASSSSGHQSPPLPPPMFRSGVFAGGADGPMSDQGSVAKPSSPAKSGKTVWDEDWPHHRLDTQENVEASRTVDFAYDQPVSTSARVPARRRTSPTSDNGNITLLDQQRPPIGPRRRNADSVRPVLPTKREVREHIALHKEPPYPPRRSSLPDRTNIGGNFEGASSPDQMVTVEAEITAESDVVPQEPLPRQSTQNWGRDKFDERDYARTDTLKGRHHLTLKDGQRFSINRGHRRQPIARNWTWRRKRCVATVACINTALTGILIGVYAGEVPAIQYTLADLNHQVILGNVYLYIGMAISTFLFWPLPLLHGRKPYTLVALGLALPLQIPQAVIVQQQRRTTTDYKGFIAGLLVSRALLGLALGFAHINFKSTLLDLYGSSLQSEFPHGEVVITDDVRRHGGGMGYWLGIWSFCFIGSISFGFFIGAMVISGLNESWGFYICTILTAFVLFINVLAPETRRSPHRRTLQEVELPNDSVSRRVARGEIKMHVSGDGPKWWWEEVFAGMYLSVRMMLQSGFLLMAVYMGWIYAQIVLIIVLLGNLLSALYHWRPAFVGLGVLSVFIGALLAVPNSKANFFSRSRVKPPRTDSMTFTPRFGWTSHLFRRALFMTALPLAGLAYTLASEGDRVPFMVPVVFAALIGYISNLAIAECNGIIMEAFDTSDLQPGTNSRHRLQSLSPEVKRRRTTYTSYPRVSAGLFCAQALGFLFAAAATGVGGAVTRTVGAQRSTAITAGILLFLTLLLTCALVRFRVVQVIPNELFGQYFGSAGAEHRKSTASLASDKSWRAVVIGNPSGKNRRMSWLELGSLSRWTEIRRLNRLLNRSTTQALNPGWQ